MNKYQEALNEIVSCCGHYVDKGWFEKDLLLIQELVDKATPKPLIEKWAWNCQNCGQGFVNHGGNKDNYCSNCGQRLTEEI